MGSTQRQRDYNPQNRNRGRGRGEGLGRRLECTDDPRTTAVDRRSTPSARADRQDLLPMFRCPDPGVFADLIMMGLSAIFPLVSKLSGKGHLMGGSSAHTNPPPGRRRRSTTALLCVALLADDATAIRAYQCCASSSSRGGSRRRSRLASPRLCDERQVLGDPATILGFGEALRQGDVSPQLEPGSMPPTISRGIDGLEVLREDELRQLEELDEPAVPMLTLTLTLTLALALTLTLTLTLTCVQAHVVHGEDQARRKVDRAQPQAEEEGGSRGALRGRGGGRLAHDHRALRRLRLQRLDPRAHLPLPRLVVVLGHAGKDDVRALLLCPTAAPLADTRIEEQDVRVGHLRMCYSAGTAKSEHSPTRALRWVLRSLASAVLAVRARRTGT